MTELSLTVPTVHLNGTGARGLLDQYEAAVHAVEHALTVLSQSAPHGRDYYVQKDTAAYTKARGEHDARVIRLKTVSDELIALHRAVNEQIGYASQR